MTTGLQSDDSGTVEAYAETVRIRVLPESALEQTARSEAPTRSFDPYSTDVGALTTPAKARRTLDDMRRLSEAIVRNRRCVK